MSELNYETSVKHEESLQLLSTRFISLLQDAKDGLLDSKMGGDILAVVLEGISCNTREKTKILKFKEELQDSKNKEIETDLNYDSEEQEDDCQDVGGKTKDKDEAMEQGDSGDNNKSKVTSAQPKRQLPPRKAAQRHIFIQSRHHDNVKNKKTSIINKKEDSTKERPTVRGRGREKDKVSSESTVPAPISRAKDYASLEEENEKKVSEKTKTRSRGRISTLNQQNNQARRQDTEDHPVNNRVNNRANNQPKTPLKYHGQDSFGEHEESEVPYVTDTENLSLRGKKVYGFPYECGFVCKPGEKCSVTRHFNGEIMFGNLKKPSCPIRRKMEVVLRDGIWPKSVKEPVFLGSAVTGSGRKKDKAAISRAKSESLAEENEKKVPEKTKTRSRGRISTLNRKNSEAGRQDSENYPFNNPMYRLASYQDKAFLEYPDLVEDILQSIKKLCSLPSRRDYFFQLDKYTGYVDLFEITDPNIDPVKFNGPDVTDYFARPRIICRPKFEAFLRREMYGSGKEAAKEEQIKYRCPYCFMLSLYRDNIERHIQSRKGYSVWRGPACIVRRHKEPNPSGIYESEWPCPKRIPIIEIDCNVVLILIYSQLGIRIPDNERKKVQNLLDS